MKQGLAIFLCALGVLIWAGLISGEVPDSIIMPHPLHHEAEVDCETCHEGIATSQSALDVHRPDMDVCGACHDVEDDANCSQCHTNVEAAMAKTPAAPAAHKYSHAAHIARGMDCASCHGDLSVMQPQIPGKDHCRTCHETADDYTDCGVCHAASENLVPVSHVHGWQNYHGVHARTDQTSCAVCHTQTHCQECHAGDDVRPRSHPLNYAFKHAIDARGNEMACATCHMEPQFCVACHAEENILPRSHSRAGWVRFPDGGQHALDGVFEIESCIACHDAGASSPTCATCHGG